MRMRLPFNLVKVHQDESGTVRIKGILAKAELDKAGEVLDWAKSRPNFEKWAARYQGLTDGKSSGNMRLMHTKITAGVFDKVTLNDADEQVEVEGEVIHPLAKEMALKGALPMLSVGGDYGERWRDKNLRKANGAPVMRFEAIPEEGSLVDNGAQPSAKCYLQKGDSDPELLAWVENQAAELLKGWDLEKDAPKAPAPEPTAEDVQGVAQKAYTALGLTKDASTAAAQAQVTLADLKALFIQMGAMTESPDAITLEDAMAALKKLEWVTGDLQAKAAKEAIPPAAPVAPVAPVAEPPEPADEPAPPAAPAPPEPPAPPAPGETDEEKKLAAGHKAGSLRKSSKDPAPLEIPDGASLAKVMATVVESSLAPLLKGQDELKATVEEMIPRLEKVEATPAQIGGPVTAAEKTLGETVPLGGKAEELTVPVLEKAVQALEATGQLDTATKEKNRLALATASQLHAGD